MSYNVLLVDDDMNQARLVQRVIEKDGQYKVRLAGSGQEAIDMLTGSAANDIDLMLLDLAMPGIDGMGVLKAVRPVKPHLPIVINSGIDDIELVTGAMKAGATDFVRKLDGEEKLKNCIASALRDLLLHDELEAMKKTMGGRVHFNDILGESQAIKDVKTLAAKVAGSHIPVLIEGENGCGKELLARSIHFSHENPGPFITVNCGAIPANLVESILFGHEKGAFTGALFKTFGKFREADGGTIFLDEVGELSPDIQVKLLRVLQDGEIDPVGNSKPVKVNVRVISATNRDLAGEVKSGRFREDLYYRLNVFPIYLPALRNRNGDLPMMIHHFIKLSVKSEQKNIKGITKEAEKMLSEYSWPGNIRQLKNTIFRAVVLCDREMLDMVDFPQFKEMCEVPQKEVLSSNISVDTVKLQNSSGHFKHLAEIEKEAIESALKRYNGRMSEVARRLGIGRSTLYRKLESYGMHIGEEVHG